MLTWKKTEGDEQRGGGGNMGGERKMRKKERENEREAREWRSRKKERGKIYYKISSIIIFVKFKQVSKSLKILYK